MPIQDKNYLKSRFENGDNPLQDDFIDLIDSFTHINDVRVDGGEYNANVWDGNGDAPTKNAVRDKIIQMDTAISGKANAVHTHPSSEITDFNNAVDGRINNQKGVADGLATLDSSGKIPNSQLPSLAITNTFVVNSQAEQLALNTQEGDVVVRVDLNKSFIKNSQTTGTMADWQELLSPTDAVLSVNGQTGNVNLTTTDIAEGTNEYFTNARVIAAPLSGLNNSLTGNIISNDSILDAFGKTSQHIGNANNPHNVTKAQVGLPDVDNIQQLPLAYLDTDVNLAANSDTKVPSQKAVKTYVDSTERDNAIFIFSKVGVIHSGNIINPGGSSFMSDIGISIPRNMELQEISLVFGTHTATGASSFPVMIRELATGSSGVSGALTSTSGTLKATIDFTTPGISPLMFYKTMILTGLSASLAAGNMLFVYIGTKNSQVKDLIVTVKCKILNS